MYNTCMIFEWNDEKSHSNQVKQGVDFDTAKALWTMPTGLKSKAHIHLKAEVF